MNLQAKKLNNEELETISGGSYTGAALYGALGGATAGLAVLGSIWLMKKILEVF